MPPSHGGGGQEMGMPAACARKWVGLGWGCGTGGVPARIQLEAEPGKKEELQPWGA